MDLLLIVLLTLLNGVFAMSEMALASSRKARLSAFEEAGDRGAIVALRLMEQPTQVLSTVQIGITSIGVLNGIVGEAAFSDSLSRWLQVQGLSVSAAGILATAVVVSLITCITIVFGELVPKRIGQMHPEAVARWVALSSSSSSGATAEPPEPSAMSSAARRALVRMAPTTSSGACRREAPGSPPASARPAW